MAICQFFLRGTCRFGDNCRNEHPASANEGGGFGNSSWNRNPSNTTSTSNKVFAFTADSIRDDLNPTKDKPLWPLSSYGPAKFEPVVIGGLDESMEELRVKAFVAKSANNPNEYLTYEANQISAAASTFSNALNNHLQVFEQAQRQSGSTPSATTASAFGTTTTPSALGGPSTSAFGAPVSTSVFGNPATTSVFGAPASTSAFGTINAPTSAFGTPANVTSAFGNISSTTTSAFGTSAFGTPASTSAFGKPTGFGQSAFGQASTTPTAPSTTSAFGQPAFGQSSFGTPSQPSSSSIIKPATGAFGAYASTGPSAFGAEATTTPASTGGGAFSAFSGGQPSAFAAAAANKPATTASGSVFGQPSFGSGSTATHPFGGNSVFGTPSTPNAFANSANSTNATTTTPTVFSAFASGDNTTSAFGTPQGSATSVFGPPQQPTVSAFGNSGSAFGPTQPASVFQTQPQQTTTPLQPGPASPFSAFQTSTASNPFGGSNASNTASTGRGIHAQKLDFSNARYDYRPGLVVADSRLPPNYAQLLPQSAIDAFRAAKFEWGKVGVPEWIPPIQVRSRYPPEGPGNPQGPWNPQGQVLFS